MSKRFWVYFGDCGLYEDNQEVMESQNQNNWCFLSISAGAAKPSSFPIEDSFAI
jgi:hypothetical protein